MVRLGHRFPELIWLQRSHARRIGLFGGSFNPVHDGHWQCAESLRKCYGLDQVWWLPTPQNPLKNISDTANYEQRFQAVETRLNRKPTHRASRLLQDSRFLYTIDFIKYLSKYRSSNDLYWLAGSDILSELHHWKDWQSISDHCQMLFYARPNHTLARAATPAALSLKSMPLVVGKGLKVSSTELRNN